MTGRTNRGVTLADVARESGVSATAASFVLSGRSGKGPAGSAETRTRVLEAAERLGYVPNRHARAIRTGRSDLIPLALGPIGDPWATSMAEAVQSLAEPSGLSTILLADDKWFDFLSGYPAAASLVTGLGRDRESDDLLRRLARGGRQVVGYGLPSGPEPFDVISTNPLAIIPDALASLRERHSRVAFFTQWLPGDTPWPSRVESFVKAAEARGDDPETAPVVRAGHGRRESFETAMGWLSSGGRTTAVIGATAYLALAMQAAAHRLDLRVPEDLEIVSIGDVPRDALMFDPISFWGVRDVFARTARIILGRAREGADRTPSVHEFTWEYFPGATTIA